MILYFSGTGNSRYVAEFIAKATGDELVSMNERIQTKNKSALVSEKPLVFVAPVYAGRIPRAVESYIREVSFAGNKAAYFVAVCAGSAWIAASYAQKLCAEKGFKLLGFSSVLMPQGYIAHAEIAPESETNQIIDAAAPKIKLLAQLIKGSLPFPAEAPGKAVMSRLLNPVMYATMISAKGFHTTAACSGCGGCVKRCPLNNVKMADNKPQWGKSCTHCMACIAGCSHQAIEYGKVTQGRIRYYNTKTPPN